MAQIGYDAHYDLKENFLYLNLIFRCENNNTEKQTKVKEASICKINYIMYIYKHIQPQRG